MKAKFKRFLSTLRYICQLEPRMLYDGIAGAVINSIKPFVLLIISKVLIEAVLNKADYVVLLRRILLLLLGYFLCSLLGGYFEKRYNYYFKKFLLKHDMHKACHLLKIPYAWTEEDSMQEHLTEILNLETKNVYGFRSFSTRLNQTCGSLAGLLLAISLSAGIFMRGGSLGRLPAWGLDLAFILLFISLFLLTLKIVVWINVQFGELIGKNTTPLGRYLKAYNALIYQYRSGKDIRLFSKELATEYTKTYLAFSEKMFTFLSTLFTKNITIETMMASLTNGVLYFFIAVKALAGTIRLSEIMLFIGAFSQLIHYAMELLDGISMLYSGDLYREKLLDYYSWGKEDDSSLKRLAPSPTPTATCKAEAAAQSISNTKESSPSPPAACQVKELSFQYPGTERTVLKNISFSLVPGEKLAIVGENGSGKTTLIKLLIGLYKDYEGNIYLNGKNAREMSAENIGQLFAPVFQDYKLLAFTLKDNVTSFTELPDTQIKEVLTQVGLKEFYDTHGPDVYLTRSFEAEGVEISGGEGQKIAMARAMLKRAAIFVLDEPTAALDPIAERDIYEKFNEIIEGKTAVFISHRLSSCKFCDRILVLDKGELVQEGTHEVLLENEQGKYRTLWNAQARHYTKN